MNVSDLIDLLQKKTRFSCMEPKQRAVNINFTAIFWLARSALFSYKSLLN